MKRIKIQQHDITDCGAACLASIAAFYKLNIAIAKIRQYAATDNRGTNLLGLIEAANKIGFIAKGVKGPFESIFQIPKPAILHVIINKSLQHYIVLININKNYIKFMDPFDGEIHKKSHKEFLEIWTGIMLLIVPSEGFRTDSVNKSVLRRFFLLLEPHKTVLVQAFFGALIYSILGLTTSIYVQKVIDFVLVEGNINLLNLLSVLMILILLLKVFISTMKSVFVLKIGQNIDMILIIGYYKHLLTLPQFFFDTMRVGEIISRINDAVKIRVFISNVFIEVVASFLIVVFTIGFMSLYSVKLAFIVFIGIVLYSVVYFIYNNHNKKYLRKIMENAADVESHLVESINNIATIKHFGIEIYSNVKTETRFIKLLKSTYVSNKSNVVINNLSELIAGGLTITIIWLGSLMVVNQEFTPGILLSFYALLAYLISPVKQLINSNQIIQDALIASDRLFQIMDLDRDEGENNKVTLERSLIDSIKFANVSFRYGTRVQVFKNLNFIAQKGMITAIVGESGSGKSSIISILQKLYPIQSGSIEIGKFNLHYIRNSSLRKLIGIVPQKIELFAGTITENIALGVSEPNMKQIIEVCEMLHLKDFIENLPGGYNASIGEHGISLSGGECQRIAIARALYKSPEILILDEATSSLDPVAEMHVKSVMDMMRSQGKTIIVISHRLSTVMHADKICVIHNGGLAEEGTHTELMKARGRYFDMWKQQFPVIESSY
jgi:ATP-binding cassette, subfamily C, bacteriocin exporter